MDYSQPLDPATISINPGVEIPASFAARARPSVLFFAKLGVFLQHAVQIGRRVRKFGSIRARFREIAAELFRTVWLCPDKAKLCLFRVCAMPIARHPGKSLPNRTSDNIAWKLTDADV